MIKLKRINGSDIIINADLIELVEETPDTVITLTNGHKMIVADTVDEVIEKVVTFKHRIVVGPPKRQREF